MIDKRHKRNRAALPVAPFNPNPEWPEGFFQVLEEAGVPEHHHPFYAHWVRQLFNRFPGRSRRSLGPQEIADFLDAVESDPDSQPWQQEQARDALILYYEQFRGISLRKMPSPSPRESKQPPPTYPRKMDVRESVPPPVNRRAHTSGSVDWTALKQAVVETLRVKNYALTTERTYWMWIRKFVSHHHGRKPSDMGPNDIHAYLGHLAVNEHVAASTQNQALNAIVFLYRDVLKQDVGDFSSFPRARKGKRLPVVCSREEVYELLAGAFGLAENPVQAGSGEGDA
jgi:hypothetical protein